jgi:cytochrome c peroxidase
MSIAKPSYHSRQALIAGLALVALTAASVPAADLTGKQTLGKSIFFDEKLSLKQNQSCAACHSPNTGFTGPSSSLNARGAVYEGSVAGRFGNRKPPSSAYATQSPLLRATNEGSELSPEWLIAGGSFWDGRATGYKLGSPAADQALGPFLNPLEQALPDEACVVYRVCTAAYPVRFTQVWGASVCAISWPDDIETSCATEGAKVSLRFGDRLRVKLAYGMVGFSIADYEASAEVNPFTSKYDYYLQGKAQLTETERKGLDLYQGRAKCALCHPVDPGPEKEPPLLTDFTYDNLGVPKNPDNPFYAAPREINLDGAAWVDRGLGGFLETTLLYRRFSQESLGKQKVPTLRNVDKRPSADFVKAFAHNGYFKTLKGIVNFYNTRDVKARCPDPMISEAAALAANCWPASEFPGNVNMDELGNLQLTQEEELAVVEFLKTLSDGYQPPQ